MLQATKAQLVTRFTGKSLELQQLELKYWLQVFEKFAVLSAFLGGFASSVLLKMQPGDVSPGFLLIHIVASGSAVGCNLTLLTISVMCSLWAPGKGLTGQGHDAYKTVIQCLEMMYVHSLRLFNWGLFFYFLTSLLSSFCFFNPIGAILITGTLCTFGYFMMRHLNLLTEKFVASSYTSAVLHGNEIQNIGKYMTSQLDPCLSGTSFDLNFTKKL